MYRVFRYRDFYDIAKVIFFTELLRRTAEHYLKDIVQLVFMRLPQFAEDAKVGYIKQIKIKSGSMEQSKTKKKSKSSFRMKSKPSEVKSGVDTIGEKTVGMNKHQLRNTSSLNLLDLQIQKKFTLLSSQISQCQVILYQQLYPVET